MSTLNRRQLAPQYPVFLERGYKPIPQEFGPPDVWPSGNGPGYSVYASAHGRNLAGVDDVNSEGIETYPNELNVLAAADDVNGNGVFDPNGTHGNIHQNEGVFADHQSIPGYMEREQFYTPSEVQDIPGGGQVMYVPGGAVSFQQGQPETLRKMRLLWELPPSMQPFAPEPLPEENIVSAPTATDAVSGLDEDVKKKQYMLWGACGLGVVVGLLAWKMKGK